MFFCWCHQGCWFTKSAEALNLGYHNLQEYSYISLKRIAYFYSSKPQPHQFTILVRGVPAPSGSSFNQIVENFFTEYHPSTYLSHTVVRRTSKIQSLMVSISVNIWLIQPSSGCYFLFWKHNFISWTTNLKLDY